jgi:ADP-ribosylglycohydrolase
MNLTAIEGALLGTAVGDALGLPYEGLSRRRGTRLLGTPDRHRFLWGHGMVSDDTEHSCMVAQSLVAAGNDVERFGVEFARRLRAWLLTLPAGVGLATLKASLRLCLGVSPQHSGVFSAGNGPAMRSAVMGAAVDDLTLLRELVRESTRITHTDPKAEYAAFAVALAAHVARSGATVEPNAYLALLSRLLPESDAGELLRLLRQAVDALAAGKTTAEFADALGLSTGVSGYAYHTVPVAIYAWLAHPRDFRAALMEVIGCGGDTDTTAAIVGGIVGAGVGKAGIPRDWLAGLWEWPRTVAWMETLAVTLDEVRGTGRVGRPPRLAAWQLLPRNLAFLAVVVLHVLRRCLPPY